MFYQFPYDTLAKRVISLNYPYSLEQFQDIFLDISSATSVQKISRNLDIQNDMCNLYLLSPKNINEKYLPVPPAYFFYRVQALLILGQRNFYLMFHCGNDNIITPHTFNQTIADFQNSPFEFLKLSAGRFMNQANYNLFSAEEDEFETNYFLITNSEWLLNSDEIFNFSRGLITI